METETNEIGKLQVFEKQHPLFNALQFVVKAINKKHTSFSIQHLAVEKNRIYGTDGCRLHIYRNDSGIDFLTEGHYYVNKITKSRVELVKNDPDIVGTYPNVDLVVPESYLHTTELSESFALFTAEVILKSKNPFDIDKLKDIYESGLDRFQWNETDHPCGFLKIEKNGEEFEAVIMPMKFDK